MRKTRIRGLLASVSLAAASLSVAGIAQAIDQPDLIPQLSNPMNASVSVINNGTAVAPPSHLTLHCTKFGMVDGGCATAPGMAAYVDPAYPNRVVIDVPILAPGEVFNHDLAFWDDIVWPAGTYVFSLIADAGSEVTESNEANNGVQSGHTQEALVGVAPPPPLPLQANPGAKPSRGKAPAKALVAELAKPDLMSTSLGTYIGGDQSLWNQVQTVRKGQITATRLGRNKDECQVPAKVRVMNIGNADSTTFAISIFDDGQLRTTKTTSLKKGENKWIDYSLRLNEGTNKVMVRIDPKNQVAEEDEQNNVYHTTVEVPFDCDGVAVLLPRVKGGAKVAPPPQRKIMKVAPLRPAK